MSPPALAHMRTICILCGTHTEIANASEEQKYDCSADIWSLGITAIQMALKETPNIALTPVQLIFAMKEDDFAPPRLPLSGFSAEFQDFVARCVVVDASERFSAQEVLYTHLYAVQ